MAPRPKHTERDRAIARRFVAGETMEALGREYGISRQYVGNILARLGVGRHTRTLKQQSLVLAPCSAGPTPQEPVRI